MQCPQYHVGTPSSSFTELSDEREDNHNIVRGSEGQMSPTTAHLTHWMTVYPLESYSNEHIALTSLEHKSILTNSSSRGSLGAGALAYHTSLMWMPRIKSEFHIIFTALLKQFSAKITVTMYSKLKIKSGPGTRVSYYTASLIHIRLSIQSLVLPQEKNKTKHVGLFNRQLRMKFKYKLLKVQCI